MTHPPKEREVALPENIVLAFKRVDALYDRKAALCRRFDQAYFEDFATQMDAIDELLVLANGTLFGALKSRISAEGQPTRPEDATDAGRWRKLTALARENAIRAGLGGGIIVCCAEPNEHDAAWASVQALDHENPRNTLWISEGQNLGEAIDRAGSRVGVEA